VAVLVENGKHGNSAAGPIARAVFDYVVNGTVPEPPKPPSPPAAAATTAKPAPPVTPAATDPGGEE
jgi:penicillin-binding protein 2